MSAEFFTPDSGAAYPDMRERLGVREDVPTAREQHLGRLAAGSALTSPETEEWPPVPESDGSIDELVKIAEEFGFRIEIDRKKLGFGPGPGSGGSGPMTSAKDLPSRTPPIGSPFRRKS